MTSGSHGANDPPGGFGLLLAFDNDTEDFRNGFELGCVWGIANSDEAEFEYMVHAANAEMLVRIAEATQRGVSWEELTDGWCFATFTERDQT